MKKFAYVCFILPLLSTNLNGKVKKDHKQIKLKTAKMIHAGEQKTNKEFHQGSCYFFDETTSALRLGNVKYKISSNDEVIVDLHLNSKEQKSLNKISKKFSKKRQVVLMLNDQVISKPGFQDFLAEAK